MPRLRSLSQRRLKRRDHADAIKLRGTSFRHFNVVFGTVSHFWIEKMIKNNSNKNYPPPIFYFFFFRIFSFLRSIVKPHFSKFPTILEYLKIVISLIIFVILFQFQISAYDIFPSEQQILRVNKKKFPRFTRYIVPWLF